MRLLCGHRVRARDRFSGIAQPEAGKHSSRRVDRFGQGTPTSDTDIAHHTTLEVPFAPTELRQILNTIASGRTFAPVLRASAAAIEAAQFSGVRALAADDSAINREVLIEALRRLGVEVTCVENGAEAVEAIKTSSFDIVFMDGSMPVMDASTQPAPFAAGRNRGGTEGADCRLSAHVVGEHAEAWRACGMSDFITKPFTLAAIRACIARWTSQMPAASTATAGQLAAETPEGRAIDLDVLQSIRDMQPPGTDLVARIVTLYADHAPNLLAKLIESAQAGLPQFASAAHALKSITAMSALCVSETYAAFWKIRRGRGDAIWLSTRCTP